MLQGKPFITMLLAVSLATACATGCSTGTGRRRPDLPIETKSYSFLAGDVFSKGHGRNVPVARVFDKTRQHIIVDLAKTHPAFEWTLALETPAGTVAALDRAVDGRAWEIPILVRRNGDHFWTEIPFQKPHSSVEVTALALDRTGVRLRLRIEPGSAPAEQITGSMKDEASDSIDFADWSYSFTRKAWSLSRTALRF